MPLTIEISNYTQKLKAAAQAVQARQGELLQIIGVQILSLSREAYVTKSRGGRGSDGISWSPVSEATRRRKAKRNRRRPAIGVTQSNAVGIDTGLQINSAQPGYRPPDGKGGNKFQVSGDRVTVGYARSYSKYFDELRPLMPDVMPQPWREEVEKQVEAFLERVLEEQL